MHLVKLWTWSGLESDQILRHQLADQCCNHAGKEFHYFKEEILIDLNYTSCGNKPSAFCYDHN